MSLEQTDADFAAIERARDLPPDELYFAGDSDCLDERHDFGDDGICRVCGEDEDG